MTPNRRNGDEEPLQPDETVEVVAGSRFNLVFLTVVCLSVALLAIDIWLSLQVSKPSEQVKQLISLCDTLAKAGIGVIFGLLGGKLAR